jgi:hypothetical protein
MKFLIALLLSLSSVAEPAYVRAEEVKSGARDALASWSLGVTLSGLGSDWGSGLALATPSFSGSGLGFALSATDYSYSEGSSYDYHYTDVALSALTRSFLRDAFRAYQRLGVGVLFPGALLASRVGVHMMLALGFEFFPAANGWLASTVSFYGELGLAIPVGGARADRVAGSPHYASGALTMLGARFYF